MFSCNVSTEKKTLFIKIIFIEMNKHAYFIAASINKIKNINCKIKHKRDRFVFCVSEII